MTKPPESAWSPNPPDNDRHVENVPTIDARIDAAKPDENAGDESYRLMGVDAVRAPEGCVGSDWYIYRIARGENWITGYRHGELPRIRADVEDIVTALNGRRKWAKSPATSKSHRRAAAARRAAAR